MLVRAFEITGMWWRRGEAWQLVAKSPIARLDRCRFVLSDLPGVTRDLLLSGRYELPERTAIRKYLRRDEPVVEFGANMGVVACTTNRLLRDPPRHLVVEANPDLIPLLNTHKRMNSSVFSVWHGAVAYGMPKISFAIQSDTLASSLHLAGGRVVTVPTVTLAEILRERSFERAAVVCDIEGAEFALLEHEATTLSRYCTTFIVEVHAVPGIADPHSFFESAMKDAGFERLERTHDTHVYENRRLPKG